MGEASINSEQKLLTITAHIITYGTAGSESLAQSMALEIALLWNEPQASVLLHDERYRVRFAITGTHKQDISPEEIWYNDNPCNNYFRIEPYAHGNISYVDKLHSNTGYFLYDNLINNSTTAAHEFGHTLGLPHPAHLDIRGHGAPGIMYPRGTLVDAPFQYDPNVPAGAKGGTMHPKYRKVWNSEIQMLGLHRLHFKNNKAIVGDFTSIFHEAETP